MAQKPSPAVERASRIRLMAFDIDGVFTDGSLYFTATGDTMKSFNSLDGYGLKQLERIGVQTAIITGRQSGIVAARAKELGITHLYQGVEDKTVALEELLAKTGISATDAGYMGDDWPDLAVMGRCGFAAAPANAHPEVVQRVHFVATLRGGHGAVREVCDAILRAQGRYDDMLAAALGA
ncbi:MULTISPECIES: HAD family hydrolase [unclassified Caballeronia]|uniref:KdsC family phosphatase n=1 Tax=unclassified Caballeronia TaxID=2646786 RepID=UPI00286652B6|nr:MULTISPECIES: HAD family hydrolase [unclassified Caballeronia]MDR5736777.1 HAD family hydrolase [Caballeronia sp. LZ016]MDR5810742.1 HAD family hydrolase [Caballeronia sp. LZ019]